MMDTSMDDLFSDFERSNHAILDRDLNSVSTFVYTEAALGEELELGIRHHDSLDCTLIYTVTLSAVGSKSGSSAEFVCPYSPSSTRLSSNTVTAEPTSVSWPTVRPCVLTTGTSTRPKLMDCRPMLLITAVPQEWSQVLQKRLGLCASLDTISPVVWLIGFSNGMVHQFRRDLKGHLHYTNLFTLPSLNPVYRWNWVDSPVCVDSSASSSRCTDDVLAAADCYGCGVACWLLRSGEALTDTLTSFQVTEFRLPSAPSEVADAQSHGSWLHFVTSSGHICSLHLSYVKVKPDCEPGTSYYRLVCEPANFPRVPSHVFPSRCLTDDQHLRPRWRFFNIQAFTRLSDGHLGAQLFSGEKARLVDLLCKPELPSPRPVDFTGNDTLLIAAIDSLTDAHKRCRAYLSILRIFRFLNDANEPTTPVDLLPSSDQPDLFSLSVQLTIRSSIQHPSCSQPFDLTVTVAPKERPVALPKLQSCCDSLSPAQLMCCLFQKGHRCHVFELRPHLTVKISYIPDGSAVEKETEPLPLFTYSELWFDADMLLDPENTSQSDWSRRLTLPETWFTCLRQGNLSEQSRILRIQAFLDWNPPALPAAFFQPGYLLTSSSTSSYHFTYPPLRLHVGMYDLDMLHWLCPVRLLSPDMKSSIAFASQKDPPHANPFTMTYRIPSAHFLQTILSDACKSTIDPSILDASDSDSSMTAETSYHLIFFPTERSLKLSWKRLPGHDFAATVGTAAHFGTNAILLTISSSCLRTLSWLHRALDQRIRSKGFSSELPCVETLRQEYCVLKALRSSLQGLKSERAVAVLDEPQMKIQSILKAFCTVRNTFASAIFSNRD